MNLNHLTLPELIKHLQHTSTDPIVLRLCELVHIHEEEGLVPILIKAGMDPYDYSFDNGRYSPDEYIHSLECDVDYYQDEAATLADEVSDLKHQLKTRTISQMLNDLLDQVEAAQNHESRLNSKIRDLEAAKKLAEDKLNAWGKLAT